MTSIARTALLALVLSAAPTATVSAQTPPIGAPGLPPGRPGMPGGPPPGSIRPGVPPRDESAKPVATGTAVLRGRVVAADSGQGLRRARVMLMATRAREPRMTLTNADGTFTFETLPADRYQLTASKPRYVDGSLGARGTGARGRPFELADGQKIENIVVALATAGVIAGRVLDDVGEPVAGSRVSAMRYRFFEGRRQLMPMGRMVTTDDMGTYRMFGLAPGQYFVSAQGEEMMAFGGMTTTSDVTSYAPTFYPSTAAASDAQPVDVVAGAEVAADITLVAARVAKVRGTVVDAAGRRIVGGFVMAMGAFGRPGFGVGGGNMIKADGSFELSGLTPGEYTLQARPQFEGESDGPGMRGAGASVPLTIAGSDISDLRLVVPVPVKIAGRVTYEGGTPSADDRGGVTASVPGTPMDSASAQVGPDGRFTLEVTPGLRRLNAWIGRGWAVKRLTYRGRELEPGDEVEVTEEPGARIDIVATNRVAGVTGSVTDGNGKPVQDYHVLIFPEDQARSRPERTRLERPDQQGRFRVENLRPGEYLAAAVRDVEQDDIMDPEALVPFRRIATPITVREGQTETVTLTLATLP